MIILLIGGFCVFNSNWFIITFPVITLIYGVMILLTGVSKIQWMMDAVRLKKGKWFLIGISALTSIVCGLVIITSPFSSTTVLWMFTGFSLIVEAVFDIISLFLVNKENYRNSAADTMMNEEIAEE